MKEWLENGKTRVVKKAFYNVTCGRKNPYQNTKYIKGNGLNADRQTKNHYFIMNEVNRHAWKGKLSGAFFFWYKPRNSFSVDADERQTHLKINMLFK